MVYSILDSSTHPIGAAQPTARYSLTAPTYDVRGNYFSAGQSARIAPALGRECAIDRTCLVLAEIGGMRWDEREEVGNRVEFSALGGGALLAF